MIHYVHVTKSVNQNIYLLPWGDLYERSTNGKFIEYFIMVCYREYRGIDFTVATCIPKIISNKLVV